MAAYVALASDIHRYPEGSAEVLREAIGRRTGSTRRGSSAARARTS